MTSRKRRVLFFAEGATLAHVGRPYVLAEFLDPEAFDVSFARPLSFAWLTAGARFRIIDLPCQDSTVFARRLDWGQPLYDYRTLSRYVADDLTIIAAERPDVIVGDFRLSLSVSARLAKVPYITVCDAYWSPERPLVAPHPVMAWSPYVPLSMAEWIFKRIAPVAMALHTLPLEKLRARHSLPSIGHDIQRCYTDADLRLFANFPALFPEVTEGADARFIGPIAWSPPAGSTLDNLSPYEKIIYVTMGSSGDPRVLTKLISILEKADYPVVVASAGRPVPPNLVSPKTQIFDFIPGVLACQRSRLVVCNGGSPTTNQALGQGVPVLGIARNMDQFLNMRAITDYGAGLALRSDRANTTDLQHTLTHLLENERFAQRAAQLATASAPISASEVFTSSIRQLVP